MKIVLLSGALKNAGDFLITKRSHDLLKHVYPAAEIIEYIGNYPLLDKIEDINQADIIVIAGGPSYTKNLYPHELPLIDDVDKLKPRIFIMGAGWYGKLTTDREIWEYHFSESTKKLLNRIETDSKQLGCRDFYAVRVLNANGYKSGIMTGCPAWYNIPYVSKRYEGNGEIKKILVSDPADIRSFGKQSIEIVKYLRKRFPNAEIGYVFHRGTKHDKFTSKGVAKRVNRLIQELDKLNVKHYDISYGCEGFELYNNCDLHIGHRVHAHIYNMSIRNLSVLIEEDSRGAGVNEALRLRGIKAYERKISSNSSFFLKAINKIFSLTKGNVYVTEAIGSYLDYIEATKGQIFNVSFEIMEQSYREMLNFIEKMED